MVVLETTPWCRTLRGLARSELEPKVEAWSEALGVELRVEWRRFASELPDGPRGWSDVDLGDRRAVLGRVEEDVLDTTVTRHLLYTTTDPKEEYPWKTAYRVPAPRVAELGFPYAEVVRILHPLHRTVPGGGHERASLPDLLRRVCSSVGVDSASGPGEESRDVVDLALSDRTAAEHLELASAATGRSFRVFEDGEARDLGDCRDPRADAYDVHREVGRDAVLREGSEPAAPEATPSGVLERLVAEAARDLKARRPVVVLLPPAQKR